MDHLWPARFSDNQTRLLMEIQRILLTAIVALLHWPALGEQFPIIIDDLFNDWEGVPTAYEDSADEGGSGVDFSTSLDRR